MTQFSDEELKLLRGCELLRDLSDKNFNTFISLSQKTSYAKNEVLLKEGQNSDYLFILLAGTVDLYKATGTSQSCIGSLASGQSIGEMRVIKNKPCSLTVTASTPTVVLCILLSKLRHLEYNQCYESILDAIVTILSHRLVSTNLLAANGKGNGTKKYIFSFVIVISFVLLLGELGVALYYYWGNKPF